MTAEHDDARRGHISVWQNPVTWTSILGVLLTLCTIIGGFLASQLYTIHGTLQTILITTSADAAAKTEQIKTLMKEVEKLDARVTADENNQTAYNYDITKQLVRLQAAQGQTKQQ